MNFIFQIEGVHFLPSPEIYIVDGRLLDGEIKNGAKCRSVGEVECAIAIINVGLGNHSADLKRRSLRIEKPPCALSSLIGCKLVSL
jgi:hypothetical protein